MLSCSFYLCFITGDLRHGLNSIERHRCFIIGLRAYFNITTIPHIIYTISTTTTSSIVGKMHVNKTSKLPRVLLIRKFDVSIRKQNFETIKNSVF